MSTKKEETPEMSIGFKHTKEFCSDAEFIVKRHHEIRTTDPETWERIQSMQFDKGRKLYLEIEVDDPAATGYLMNWLHGKDKDQVRWSVFGCKLQTIHFSTESFVNTMKEKLHKFIENEM